MTKLLLSLTVLLFSLLGKAQEKVYTVVDEMPYFKGCITHLTNADKLSCSDEWILRLISENIDYSKIADTGKLKGIVYVSFIVNKLGQVGNVEILRGIKGSPSYAEEAIRVIQNLPDYMPGKQKGVLAKVKYNLPVRFDPFSRRIEEEPEIFTIVEDMPIWEGCEGLENRQAKQNCTGQNIRDFITKRTDSLNSTEYTHAKLKGKAYVQFMVDELGVVANVKTVKSSGNLELDAAAVSIVSELPVFIPGNQRGKPARVQYTAPVSFK